MPYNVKYGTDQKSPSVSWSNRGGMFIRAGCFQAIMAATCYTNPNRVALFIEGHSSSTMEPLRQSITRYQTVLMKRLWGCEKTGHTMGVGRPCAAAAKCHVAISYGDT